MTSAGVRVRWQVDRAVGLRGFEINALPKARS